MKAVHLPSGERAERFGSCSRWTVCWPSNGSGSGAIPSGQWDSCRTKSSGVNPVLQGASGGGRDELGSVLEHWYDVRSHFQVVLPTLKRIAFISSMKSILSNGIRSAW